MLTKSMAFDMRHGRVRVNCIAPAYVWTPEVARAKPENCKELLQSNVLCIKFQLDQCQNLHLQTEVSDQDQESNLKNLALKSGYNTKERNIN